MSESNHHPSGPLTVAVALAAAAGFADAHIYVNVTPIFVANMSGNLIHLGILVGDASWRAAVASLLTLAAFTAGVVVATVHLDRQVRRVRTLRPTPLLAAEAVLLVGLALWMSTTSIHFTSDPRPIDHPVLVVAGLAMGLQAAALRRVGQVAVATTYGTGAIVRIGEKLVLAARRADRATEHRRRVAIAILALVLASYVAGAVVATVAGADPRLLLLPGGVVAACALASRGRFRSPTESPEHVGS
ncbi:MAG: DUF1275 domain-containing protein [Acidimicrobiales bacterium]|nr:DUF1275 domain-containing protein [Acidimicrobiales bacterium]